MIDAIDSHLTQAERLELCSGRFSPAVLGVHDALTVTISTSRFRMPSMQAVRENDARLSHGIATRDASGDFLPNEAGYEKDAYGSHVANVLIPTACALPSTRSRAHVRDSLRSMGVSWE